VQACRIANMLALPVGANLGRGAIIADETPAELMKAVLDDAAYGATGCIRQHASCAGESMRFAITNGNAFSRF
jgi:hypothetical protein